MAYAWEITHYYGQTANGAHTFSYDIQPNVFPVDDPGSENDIIFTDSTSTDPYDWNSDPTFQKIAYAFAFILPGIADSSGVYLDTTYQQYSSGLDANGIEVWEPLGALTHVSIAPTAGIPGPSSRSPLKPRILCLAAVATGQFTRPAWHRLGLTTSLAHDGSDQFFAPTTGWFKWATLINTLNPVVFTTGPNDLLSDGGTPYPVKFDATKLRFSHNNHFAKSNY